MAFTIRRADYFYATVRDELGAAYGLLAQLAELGVKDTAAPGHYDSYEFHLVAQKLQAFCSEELGGFYLDILKDRLYTLGTNTANHSALDYDPYRSHYVLHVSGKWLDPPIAKLKHGIDKDLHYWRDIIDRIAPPFVKSPGNRSQWSEVPEVIKNGWINEGERMDEQTLRYIVTEKDQTNS